MITRGLAWLLVLSSPALSAAGVKGTVSPVRDLVVVLIQHTWKCHETETGEMVRTESVAPPESLRELGSLQVFPTVISFLTTGLLPQRVPSSWWRGHSGTEKIKSWQPGARKTEIQKGAGRSRPGSPSPVRRPASFSQPPNNATV